MPGNGQTDIFDRVLDLFTACLTPEVATRIVNLRADAERQSRVDSYAAKAHEGELSADESQEYERIRSAFHFITILPAKARQFLNCEPSAKRGILLSCHSFFCHHPY